MPPRRRTRKVMRQEEESEDTDNTDVKTTRRSSRRKNVTPKSKVRKEKEIDSENDYDADSENDVKILDLHWLSVKHDSDEYYPNDNPDLLARQFTKIKQTPDKKKHIKVRNFEIIIAKNDLSLKSSSSVESDDLSDSYADDKRRSNNSEIMKPLGKTSVVGSKRAAIEAFMKNPKNKENVTPPDSHSTPALMKLVSRNLDDTLFGFNTPGSLLPFSPVGGQISTQAEASCSAENNTSSWNSTALSPNKRKLEKEATGFYDLPIEMPKKKQRRKKVAKCENVDKNLLENLRSQFEEVEMHELVIE